MGSCASPGLRSGNRGSARIRMPTSSEPNEAGEVSARAVRLSLLIWKRALEGVATPMYSTFDSSMGPWPGWELRLGTATWNP